MEKKATYTLIGLALVAVGVVMFFKSVRVYSWGFYRLGNERFETRLKNYTGFTAQIIQHEIDHCDGILI